jgi:hypothetical protein
MVSNRMVAEEDVRRFVDGLKSVLVACTRRPSSRSRAVPYSWLPAAGWVRLLCRLQLACWQAANSRSWPPARNPGRYAARYAMRGCADGEDAA